MPNNNPKGLVPVSLPALNFQPSTPTPNIGDIYFNTTLGAIQVYKGMIDGWQTISGAGSSLSEFLLMGA